MSDPLKMSPEQFLKTTTEVDRINKELKAKKVAPSNSLDKDAFLRLLTKQLSKQDPLSPMSNTDFIAQMAQFTALEQMKNMNTSMTGMKQDFSKMQVLSMIGKNVSYLHERSGKILEGHVEKVLMQSDGALLHINGADVPLSALLSVEKNNAGIPANTTAVAPQNFSQESFAKTSYATASSALNNGQKSGQRPLAKDIPAKNIQEGIDQYSISKKIEVLNNAIKEPAENILKEKSINNLLNEDGVPNENSEENRENSILENAIKAK